MKSSAELQAWIEASIRDYCSETSEEPPHLKELAGQFQLLPVLIDWTGFWGLRPDGGIFMVSTEAAGEARLEEDERVRRVAIVCGTKRYPELKPLVPVRPPDARDCPHCEGRGRIDVPGVAPEMIVCFCGGSGWLREKEL